MTVRRIGAALLALCLGLVLCGCVRKSSTDPAVFARKRTELLTGDLHTDLLILPEEPGEVEACRVMEEDGLLDGDYLFYLVCRYDEEEYAREEERLRGLTVYFPRFDASKAAYYTEEGFAYPAVVTVLDGNGSYEYALLDGENSRVIYVSNQMFRWSLTDVPAEYRPESGFRVPEELIQENWAGFSVYYWYEDNAGWRSDE